MTWVKTDDAFWRSQRTLDLLDLGQVGVAAIALDRLVEAWVGEALTDGCVPSGQPARVFAPNDPGRAIAALVKAGLWEERPDGWYLTTWFEPYGTKRKPRNPTKAEVLLDRQRRHELGVLGGTANARSVDDEGRRDTEGKFEPNRPVGPTDGLTAGQTAGATDGQPTARTARLDKQPTARLDGSPTVEPTPYPVPRRRLVPYTLDSAADRDVEPLLTARQRDAWRSFGPEWSDFQRAWLGRGFKLPPKGSLDDIGSQRAIVWEIFDARPKDALKWAREAPGRSSHAVVGYMLSQYKAVAAGAASS